jgi:hypothetical protein
MQEHIHEQVGPKTYASGKTGPIHGDSRNIWFLVLLGTFSTITVIAIIFLRHNESVQTLLSPLWLTMLALASHRLGRIVALDEVTQPFRLPFVELRELDGQKLEVPRKEGFRGAVGTLISSPDSIGFWIAGILVYLYILWPPGLRMIIIVLAVSGLAELLNGIVQLVAPPQSRELTYPGLAPPLRRYLPDARSFDFPPPPHKLASSGTEIIL